MKVVVYHSSYGCETGCCGHTIQFTDVNSPNSGGTREHFKFDHPNVSGLEGEEREAAYKKFAEDLVRDELGEEHVKDLDWAGCEIFDD